MRILHVDGSNDRHLEMVLTCRHHEIVVHFAESGDEAISILVRDQYDCVVIAPDLEDFESPDLLRRLRKCRVRAPILMVGDEASAELRARCLWDGADDYVNLPWDREEMVARMRALVRRAHGHTHSLIHLGPLVIDQEQMRVLIGDRLIGMTEKEYLVLEHLATRAGRVCSKEQIMGHLYSTADDEPEEKIIDVFVCKLRRKLGPHGSIVRTVWGRGYMAKVDAA